MKNLMVLKDMDGKHCVFTPAGLTEEMAQYDFLLLGIPMQALLEIRRIYDSRNGPREVTPESIRVVFER